MPPVLGLLNMAALARLAAGPSVDTCCERYRSGKAEPRTADQASPTSGQIDVSSTILGCAYAAAHHQVQMAPAQQHCRRARHIGLASKQTYCRSSRHVALWSAAAGAMPAQHIMDAGSSTPMQRIATGTAIAADPRQACNCPPAWQPDAPAARASVHWVPLKPPSPTALGGQPCTS